MKNYLPFLIALFFFLSSCISTDDNTDELIIDPEQFSYVLNWKENGSKTGELNWENISDGQELSFYSNFVDEELGLPDNGKIHYEPNLDISIQNKYYFERTDSTFIIYSSPLPEYADTLIVAYSLFNDSTLILKDSSIFPAIAIKYVRLN